MMYKSGTIILIATDSKFFEILDSHLNSKYNIIPLDNFDSLDLLSPNWNIKLFLINTDRPWIGLQNILDKIKSSEHFMNIPAIGLSLKKHYHDIDEKVKYMFEDILLMPCGAEDLLTRVDVWIKTYNVVCSDEIKPITFHVEMSNESSINPKSLENSENLSN
ncbi:MAG: hypothetical protein ACTSWC_11810 [Promethearchaeota archaeon]